MKHKILSFLTAFAMVFGIIAAPFVNASAADEEHKTDVVVHKVELKDLTGWPKDADAEINGVKYDGSKLGKGTKEAKGQFENYFGKDAKELANVKFNYWKVTEADYKVLDAEHATYNNTKAVEDKLKELVATRNKGKEEAEKEAVPATQTVTTGENGATIEGLSNGYYWFVEDTDSVSRDGRTFAKGAAVPFGLALPYAKADGKPFGQGDDALHVYPKNMLADKPQVDKDFKGKANPETPRSAKEKNKPESHNVGDKIPYEIKTVFQPNSEYKTAFWTDQMTEGLEFKEDDQEKLTVKVGGTTLTKDTDYTVKFDKAGKSFRLDLTETGLKNVNKKTDKTTVLIEYTATLTNKAVVDVPESNDVIFHYGNNPSKGNTPVPNKPSKGKITFTKSWDGEVPKGTSITVTLYNANTGAKVGESKVLTSTDLVAEWTGLDADTEYKVVETGIDNWDAEYTKGEAGVLGATNHKTNNPAPINPDEPKVVTRGKKFVKMEKDKDIRLKDAIFYVKNGENQYLQPSNGADKSAFESAQKAYSDAVAAYNKLGADKQTKEEKDKVQKLADSRDKAWNEYLSNMTQWGDKGTALELKSDEAGAFEIKGLKDGTYYLEEKEAPKGYAKIEQPIQFELGDGSYTTGDINYNPLVTGNNAKRVDNTKLSIPQTGGIGSIIFVVAGLTIMGLAAYKMKANKEEA